MGEKIAQKLYQWLEQLPHKPDWLLYNGNVREDILALEPTADVTRRQRETVLVLPDYGSWCISIPCCVDKRQPGHTDCG